MAEIVIPPVWTPIAYRMHKAKRSEGWTTLPNAVVSIPEAHALHRDGLITMAQRREPECMALLIMRRSA